MAILCIVAATMVKRTSQLYNVKGIPLTRYIILNPLLVMCVLCAGLLVHGYLSLHISASCNTPSLCLSVLVTGLLVHGPLHPVQVERCNGRHTTAVWRIRVTEAGVCCCGPQRHDEGTPVCVCVVQFRWIGLYLFPPPKHT